MLILEVGDGACEGGPSAHAELAGRETRRQGWPGRGGGEPAEPRAQERGRRLADGAAEPPAVEGAGSR